ncbi:MAG: class I lanthipeptide [Candidatus Aminicenantes bacterium]|nr:class I lanthipeptide [Candidatus Aminicenantes bacterium]
MKKKRFIKRLALNKKTISSLNHDEMKSINGKSAVWVCSESCSAVWICCQPPPKAIEQG